MCQTVNICLLALSLILLVSAVLVQMTASNSAAYLLLLLFFYPYLGYPAVLAFVALFKQAQLVTVEDYCPSLTLLIVAYNEEAIIEEKLKNSLALAYPDDKLKIVAVSDGSSDATGRIMESFAKDGIDVVLFPENRGKISAINAVMESIDTELVVLSDANVMYEQQALKNYRAILLMKRSVRSPAGSFWSMMASAMKQLKIPITVSSTIFRAWRDRQAV